MFKSGYTLLLLILLYAPNLTFADQQMSQILDGVQKTYSQLPGLRLSYEREAITRSMAMLGGGKNKDLATGQLFFQPPNFVKIQQETPNPETMYAEGPVLWYYIPHKKEVYRYSSPDFIQLFNDIFQGLIDVEERFDTVLLKTGEDGKYELKLSPNPPWSSTKYLKLTVSQTDYVIQKIEIFNYAGGITRFILGEFHVEDSFPEGFFIFDVPDGVDVIEEEG